MKIQVRLVWLLTILMALESASNSDGPEYIDICIKVNLLIPTWTFREVWKLQFDFHINMKFTLRILKV